MCLCWEVRSTLDADEFLFLELVIKTEIPNQITMDSTVCMCGIKHFSLFVSSEIDFYGFMY